MRGHLFTREKESVFLMIQSNGPLRVFRGTLVVVCLLLVVQYLLGMLVNLTVPFPANLPRGNAWRWAFTATALVPLHVLVGTLILLASLLALGLSLVARSAPAVVAAIIGVAMIVLAYISGVSFLSSGQQNASSLLMALGFLGALLAYLIGWGMTQPARSALPRTGASSTTMLRQRDTAAVDYTAHTVDQADVR